MTSRAAMFPDRDGTLERPEIRDGRTCAPRRLRDFRLLPGVARAVRALREAGSVTVETFTRHRAPTTLITLEVPSRRNKLYPMPFEVEKARAGRYFAEMPDGVFSIGRLGSYLYDVDIDDTIDQAMRVADKLRS